MAIEEDYRPYREVIAASIKLLRPHVEVMSTDLEGLEREAVSFEPDLFVSSLPRTAVYPPPAAWVEVPTKEPTKPTEVWIGEDRWEADEPKAALLARVIDSTEERA